MMNDCSALPNNKRDAELASKAPLDAGETSLVTMKGSGKGVEIHLDATASATALSQELAGKLNESKGFFDGSDVTLRFDGQVPRGYLSPIEEITLSHDLRIAQVLGIEPVQEKKSEEIAEKVEPVVAVGSEPVSALPAEKDSVVPELGQALPPKLVVGPIRSGVVLEVDGHLIVLGDVNPGAQVSATGSVVVLGRLRGTAQVGSSAFILALQLEPQQLRVGRLVARAGDADQAASSAEIAYEKDGGIVVEKYKGRVPFGVETAKF